MAPRNDDIELDEKIAEQENNPGPQRIQFLPLQDRPERAARDDGTVFHVATRTQSVGSTNRRPQSIVSLPPVISAKDRKIREKEAKDQVKHVDVSEHLMAIQDVAARYKTNINTDKPGESRGLTTEQAAQLLLEHGPNNLTPPKKRHWILKFWDCLSSLFNLLLILAGVLEYILLGIDFKDNFQNVSIAFTQVKALANNSYRHTSVPFSSSWLSSTH